MTNKLVRHPLPSSLSKASDLLKVSSFQVAVISSNRVEWAVSAYSAFSLGAWAQLFPAYA
jgi:long-subunit acyl-CoA synthetase (AMP-forming)